MTVVFSADRVSAAPAQSSVGLLKQWGVGPNRINTVAVRRGDGAETRHRFVRGRAAVG